MAFNLGAFLGGAGVGYKFVQDAEAQAEDTKWKRTERERAQKKYAKEDSADAASEKAMSDAEAEANRRNALPSPSSTRVTLTPDAESPVSAPQSMAANPDAPSYGPNPSSMAAQIGVSQDLRSPIASASTATIDRPKVTKEDMFWNEYSKGLEAQHIQNNNLPAAETVRKMRESNQIQQYGKTWMAANNAVQSGNYEAALPVLENLYNQNLPDGKFVKVTKGEGDAFTVTQYDEAGNQLGAKTATAKEIAGSAIQGLEPAKAIELITKHNMEMGVLTQKQAQLDKTEAGKMAREEMRNTANAMLADKRFATMISVADARAKRGELGGKQPTHVATAEWLKERGIAKTDAEAWKMATQLGEAVNEKVTTDQYGNTTTADPQTGEITRFSSDGVKTVVRPATKAKGGVTVAPKTVTELPSGAKQIGTSGGKPVYQDANGKKFMQN